MAELLYSKSYAGFVLGSIMCDTTLLNPTKYPLEKYDFAPSLTQKLIFVSIAMLRDSGAKKIEPKEIAELLSNYPQYEEALKSDFPNGDYLSYLQSLIDLDNKGAYEFYYKEVRKRSALRYYRDNGYDISELYDETKAQDSQDEKLTQLTIEDIINYFDKIQYNAKHKYVLRANEEEYVAGTDFAQTKEQFKTTPSLGTSLWSKNLNEIFGGNDGLIVRASDSGGGKTTTAIADMCKFSATQLYNPQTKQFEKNLSREGASLFINTEMDIRKQLDTMIIACISNVERRHIKRNEYVGDEEERVDKANEILLESGIYILDMPEFTVDSLSERIDEYSKMYNVKNVIFDYIQNNGFVAKEIQAKTKIPQREDMVLLQMTESLKQAQRRNHIGILSSVQTNGQEETMEIPTVSCIAGSKGLVRKLDGCIIMLPPKRLEKQAIEAYEMAEKRKHNHSIIIPNMVTHLIKGRESSYEKHIKLYQYVDFGTCRYYDCFVTDKDNKPIDFEGLEILAKEE